MNTNTSDEWQREDGFHERLAATIASAGDRGSTKLKLADRALYAVPDAVFDR